MQATSRRTISEDDPIAEHEERRYGLHERLAQGVDVPYAFVACGLALSVSGLAAYKGSMMQEEIP